MRVLNIVFFAALVGCGAVDSSDTKGPAASSTQPKSYGGIGPTLGGCPESEPAAGDACDVAGRMCSWTRTCADGGDTKATNTGWCTAAGKWRIVVKECAEGCPEKLAVTVPSQFGGPPDAHCKPGLECSYPSTPMGSGLKCTCSATSDGRTVWPQVCEGWDDGWKPAPGPFPREQSCVELAPCAGSSGCRGGCSDGKSMQCGCAEDGKLYCSVREC